MVNLLILKSISGGLGGGRDRDRDREMWFLRADTGSGGEDRGFGGESGLTEGPIKLHMVVATMVRSLPKTLFLHLVLLSDSVDGVEFGTNPAILLGSH
ncbi:hypothetical protein RYX36_010220 [Vicia faba]